MSKDKAFMIGWMVHYREEDSQGGFWRMDPKGPYNTLKTAKEAAYKLTNRRSSLNGKRYRNERVRGVYITLRLEVPFGRVPTSLRDGSRWDAVLRQMRRLPRREAARSGG